MFFTRLLQYGAAKHSVQFSGGTNPVRSKTDRSELQTLTGRVVVQRRGLVLAAVVVPEQSFVVTVLIPVEGFDLQAATFRVTTHDPGNRLVHGAGGRGGVLRQEDDLVPQVDPTLHAGQLATRDRKHTRSETRSDTCL